MGTALEEAGGCSSESGIMVLEQNPARKQGAPNRYCHRTIPTVSASPLTTTAWWPMSACSCRPPSPITLSSTARRGGLRSRLRGQGATHPRDLPAQLPVGPRPPAGPGEPPVAGTRMAGRVRPRRLAPDHRPGLDHLRDLRHGQGGSAPPRLYRRPWLSPAAGHCRRHRRRADVPAARGPGQHRSGRWTLPA